MNFIIKEKAYSSFHSSIHSALLSAAEAGAVTFSLLGGRLGSDLALPEPSTRREMKVLRKGAIVSGSCSLKQNC